MDEVSVFMFMFMLTAWLLLSVLLELELVVATDSGSIKVVGMLFAARAEWGAGEEAERSGDGE